MFEDDNDVKLLARLIWGEARGEPLEGKFAVACTVRNRVNRPRWWGKTYREVILKKWQYSCFNENDPNLDKIKGLDADEPLFVECMFIANGIINDLVRDNTYGSTHYHTVSIHPNWADKMEHKCTIHAHKFYRES